MDNFRQGGNRGGGFRSGGGSRPSFQKRSWPGEDREKVMHKAVCDECGKTCEVPFRPTGEKPVYCSDCFGLKRDSGDDRRSYPPSSDRGWGRDSNDRPKPRTDSVPAHTHDDSKKQLAEISKKLDLVIGALEKLSAPKTEPKKEIIVEKKTAPVVVLKPEKTATPATKTAKKKVATKTKK